MNARKKKRKPHFPRRAKQAPANSFDCQYNYDSMLDAYMAGDFASLFAMECERDGIDPFTLLPIGEVDNCLKSDPTDLPCF